MKKLAILVMIGLISSSVYGQYQERDRRATPRPHGTELGYPGYDLGYDRRPQNRERPTEVLLDSSHYGEFKIANFFLSEADHGYSSDYPRRGMEPDHDAVNLPPCFNSRNKRVEAIEIVAPHSKTHGRRNLTSKVFRVALTFFEEPGLNQYDYRRGRGAINSQRQVIERDLILRPGASSGLIYLDQDRFGPRGQCIKSIRVLGEQFDGLQTRENSMIQIKGRLIADFGRRGGYHGERRGHHRHGF